jgi:hypothetical protein
MRPSSRPCSHTTRPMSRFNLTLSELSSYRLDEVHGLGEVQAAYVERTPSPMKVLFSDSGHRTSPVTVVNMSVCISACDSPHLKTPFKAKRESATLIAHRKWKANIKRSISPPKELTSFKIKKRTRMPSVPAKTPYQLLPSEPIHMEQVPHFTMTMTPKNKRSRLGTDELVRHLMLSRKIQRQSMMKGYAAPMLRVALPTNLHKHVQSEDEF